MKLALHVDSQLTWQFLLSSVYSHWINDYKGLENRDLLRKISNSSLLAGSLCLSSKSEVTMEILTTRRWTRALQIGR